MSGFKTPGFADRQKAAQEARQNILAKFKAQPGADDPAVQARLAERATQAAAREEKKAAREAEKAAAKVRAAEEAEAEAARLARESEDAEAARLAAELEQKAARDARYAARKARKK
ncbi:MAG: DUF6481 family protein [Hyphomicrobiales bacterium]|jgi:hypothetical protein|nr:DUF6481 family protein [Hyphomicrobiales bacterium]